MKIRLVLLILALFGAWLVSGAAYTQTFTPPTLACLPLPRLNGDIIKLPSGISDRFGYVGIWSCDLPTKIVSYAFLFSWGEAKAVAKRSITVDDVNALCAKTCVALTASEQTYLDQMLAQYGAKGFVAANRGAQSRPVYGANADRTKNDASRPERVAVGAKCDLSKRLAGTDYFSVAGQPNVATADPDDVLPDVYAVCEVRAPLGLN